MRTFEFATVDVFTDYRFGGNPLAVFPDARGLSASEMQSLAAEFNLSETTFVLPPGDPEHSARVRIFTRTSELPFAGHPNVGTAFVLATSGLAPGDRLTFEELAGLVVVDVERDGAGNVRGATIAAPQPLHVGAPVSEELVARCTGLETGDIVSSRHGPVWASVGNPYVLAEVSLPALRRAVPDLRSFREAFASAPTTDGRFSIHLYAQDGAVLRARMFAPLSGTVEDPATGSANAPLGALLLSLTSDDHQTFDIWQGVEMGRPSRLRVVAARTSDGIRATVGGSCVRVMRGEVVLESR